MERWVSLSIQSLKQKGILPPFLNQHFKYSDDKILGTHLQMLDLVAMLSFPDHTDCVTTIEIIYFVELVLIFLHQ